MGLKSNRIIFHCGFCTRSLVARRSQIGKSFTCPFCYHKVTVPAESDSVPRNEDLYTFLPEGTTQIDDKFITVTCPLCSARVTGEIAEIGYEIPCPDCDTLVRLVKKDGNSPQPGDLTAESADKISVYGIRSDLPDSINLSQGNDPSESFSEKIAKEIPVKCGLCGTLMYAQSFKVGQMISCPDCGTETKVVPLPDIPQESLPTSFEGASEYAVSDAASGYDPNCPQIRVYCSLCATQMYAPADMVGRQVECPDCQTLNTVPDVAPTYYGHETLKTNDATGYAVGQPIERQEYRVVDDYRQLPENKGNYKNIDAGDDDLSDSLQAVSEKQRWIEGAKRQNGNSEEPKSSFAHQHLPDMPMIQGVFRIFTSGLLWYVFMTLVIFGSVSGGLFSVCIKLIVYTPGGSAGAGLFLPYLVTVGIGAPLMIYTLASLGKHSLMIFEISADGGDSVDELPEFELFNWIGEAFIFVGLPLLISGVPLCILAHFYLPGFAILGTILGISLFFPVVLLSVMMNESPLEPLSFKVLWTIPRRFFSWAGFYVQTLPILCIMVAITYGVWLHSAILVGVLVAPWILFVFFYFRLLGRLGWCIVETLRGATENDDDDDDDD